MARLSRHFLNYWRDWSIDQGLLTIAYTNLPDDVIRERVAQAMRPILSKQNLSRNTQYARSKIYDQIAERLISIREGGNEQAAFRYAKNIDSKSKDQVINLDPISGKRKKSRIRKRKINEIDYLPLFEGESFTALATFVRNLSREGDYESVDGYISEGGTVIIETLGMTDPSELSAFINQVSNIIKTLKSKGLDYAEAFSSASSVFVDETRKFYVLRFDYDSPE